MNTALKLQMTRRMIESNFDTLELRFLLVIGLMVSSYHMTIQYNKSIEKMFDGVHFK